MKKVLLILLAAALLAAVPFSAQQAEPHPLSYCNQFLPYGFPDMPLTLRNYSLICRTAYVLSNDLDAKIPEWVSYTITPQHTLGCISRSDAFSTDQALPKGKRAMPADYVGSGYDMGHMAPDGDMSWDEVVEHESFILSNMSPQLPGLNRAAWRTLELDVRAWAYMRNHTLLIYVGPIYDISMDKKIGKDKVDVPKDFYKIIIDTETSEVLAFVYPQKDKLPNDISRFQVSVQVIEAITGIKFGLPVGAKPSTMEPLTNWPVDTDSFTKAKQASCKDSK